MSEPKPKPEPKQNTADPTAVALNKGTSAQLTGKHLLLSAPKQRQGADYERQGCVYLQAQGLQLLAQNWLQPKVGELDLVMLEQGKAWQTLVFVEVRVRKASIYGDAAMSVTRQKQRKLIQTARYFLQHHCQYQHLDCRFDVLCFERQDANIYQAQPEWIQAAFMAADW